MRVVAGILGVAFVVFPVVALVQGEVRGGLFAGFVIGPAFLAYAWGGQKALEKVFPQFAEATRKKKKRPAPTTEQRPGGADETRDR